jgi:hypothetical protein
MAYLTALLTAMVNIQAFLRQMEAKLGSHQEEIRTNQAKIDAEIKPFKGDERENESPRGFPRLMG